MGNAVIHTPFGPFWSVKQLLSKKLLIRTAHIFLESRHSEVTKNPYYVLSFKGSQKKWYQLSIFTISIPPLSAVLSYLKFISTLRAGSAKYYINILPITDYHISMDSLGFLSPTRAFLKFSPKPVYSTMVAEKFQIYSIKITGNTLVSQKTESVQFYSCPQNKTLSQVFIIIPQADGNVHSLWSSKNFLTN